MIHDFLVWVGWYADYTFQQGYKTFWSYPLGLACSSVICVYCFFRAVHPHYKSDWLDTLYNGVNGLLFLMAFCSGLVGEFPHYIVKTWLISYAVRCLLRGILDWRHGLKKAR